MKSTVLSAQFIKHLQSTFTKRKTGVQNRLPPLSKNWYFPWFEKYTILSLINDYPQFVNHDFWHIFVSGETIWLVGWLSRVSYTGLRFNLHKRVCQ